ncbi:MAG: NAD-dependent epimerase/dehydratase family protein [Myxococcaceae bacterium]
MRHCIVVAGASGFVGRALVEALRQDHDVVALTRSRTPPPEAPGLQWRTADLFSLLDVEKALEGATHAYYLVHSMLPSAELTQGNFEDFDLILADNFARVAHKLRLKQVIYLGGYVPDVPKLSRHLLSRREVEETFKANDVPVTAIRSGLVIGPNGSSFRIVERLVRRLPVMIAPKWTQQPTQPIALGDLVRLLVRCLDDPKAIRKVIEVGGPDVLTYRELMTVTAQEMGLRRKIIPIRAFSPGLSTLWVSLITQVSSALVSPLVQSLKLPMVAKDLSYQQGLGIKPQKVRNAIRDALADAKGTPYRPAPNFPTKRDVRSVQRMPLPTGWTAQDVAREYVRFLPRFMWPFLRVATDPDGSCRFYLRFSRKPLLVLSYSEQRATQDRQLFYITGGWLAGTFGPDPRARFEFREVLAKGFVLAAIHSFKPKLPWALYNVTQAVVHWIVMTGFGRHLRRLKQQGAQPAMTPPLAG